MEEMHSATAAMREEIKKSARRLFATRGYDQTRIEDILQELKISRQTFISCFPSKDYLLEELWSE